MLNRGDVVVGVDNLNGYYDPARKQANLEAVRSAAPDPGKFIFHKADIRDEAAMEAFFAEHAFDAVIHLAAMAGVRASMDDPRLYFDVNLGGTLTLLEAARKHGQPLFVFASTSSVYGRTQVIPFIETDRAEMRDLAATHPDQVTEMVALWEDWARKNEVAFPERFNMYEFLKKRAAKK